MLMNPVVYGTIKVLDGFVCAMATCQDELGSRLDELVKMVLDEGLHHSEGVFVEICETRYILTNSKIYILLP